MDSIPKSAKDFADRARISLQISEEDAAEIERLPNHDLDFTSIRQNLLKNTRFTRRATTDPIVKGFLANATSGFRDHWLWASQVLHATNLDLENVIVAKPDDAFTINIDSRNKHPNRSVADFAQRAFVTAMYITQRFELSLNPNAEGVAVRLQNTAAAYLTSEAASVRGMHD